MNSYRENVLKLKSSSLLFVIDQTNYVDRYD